MMEMSRRAVLAGSLAGLSSMAAAKAVSRSCVW